MCCGGFLIKCLIEAIEDFPDGTADLGRKSHDSSDWVNVFYLCCGRLPGVVGYKL